MNSNQRIDVNPPEQLETYYGKVEYDFESGN